MSIVLLSAVALFIILQETPALVRKKQFGEAFFVIVLVTIGFALALLQILGISIPSPASRIVFLAHKLLRLVGVDG